MTACFCLWYLKTKTKKQPSHFGQLGWAPLTPKDGCHATLTQGLVFKQPGSPVMLCLAYLAYIKTGLTVARL